MEIQDAGSPGPRNVRHRTGGAITGDPLVETWQVHNRTNLDLLDAIAEEALGPILNGKGRSVRDQFAHIHDVRCISLRPTE